MLLPANSRWSGFASRPCPWIWVTTGSPPRETGQNLALVKVGGILTSKAKKNKHDAIRRDRAGLREEILPALGGCWAGIWEGAGGETPRAPCGFWRCRRRAGMQRVPWGLALPRGSAWIISCSKSGRHRSAAAWRVLIQGIRDKRWSCCWVCISQDGIPRFTLPGNCGWLAGGPRCWWIAQPERDEPRAGEGISGSRTQPRCCYLVAPPPLSSPLHPACLQCLLAGIKHDSQDPGPRKQRMIKQGIKEHFYCSLGLHGDRLGLCVSSGSCWSTACSCSTNVKLLPCSAAQNCSKHAWEFSRGPAELTVCAKSLESLCSLSWGDSGWLWQSFEVFPP